MVPQKDSAPPAALLNTTLSGGARPKVPTKLGSSYQKNMGNPN